MQTEYFFSIGFISDNCGMMVFLCLDLYLLNPRRTNLFDSYNSSPLLYGTSGLYKITMSIRNMRLRYCNMRYLNLQENS